jgi:hypothetical protein
MDATVIPSITSRFVVLSLQHDISSINIADENLLLHLIKPNLVQQPAKVQNC